MPENDPRTPAGDGAENTKPEEVTTPPADDNQEDKEGEESASHSQKTKEEDSDKSGDDDVKISKKEYNRLQAIKRKSERSKPKASSNKKSSTGRFSFEEPEENDGPDFDEAARQDQAEFYKVKTGVAELLIDNDDYRSLVKSNPTLARIIKKDPLALLDETPVDAEDALSQITDYFDDLVENASSNSDKGSSDKDTKKAPTPASQKVDKSNNVNKEDNKLNDYSTTQDKVENGILKRLG